MACWPWHHCSIYTVVSTVSAVYLVSARWSVGVFFSSLSSSSNLPSARTPTPPPQPPSLPRTACPTSTWPGSSSSMQLVLAWIHRSTPKSSPMSICTFLMTVVETLRGMRLAFFFLRLSLFVSVMMQFLHKTFWPSCWLPQTSMGIVSIRTHSQVSLDRTRTNQASLDRTRTHQASLDRTRQAQRQIW